MITWIRILAQAMLRQRAIRAAVSSGLIRASGGRGIANKPYQKKLNPKVDVTLQPKNVAHVLKSIEDIAESINGYRVDVGVFSQELSSRGLSIQKIARINEFGGWINHPGGTPYYLQSSGSYPKNFRPIKWATVEKLATQWTGRDTGTVEVRGSIVHVSGAHGIFIPERSFLRSTMNRNRAKYARMMRREVKLILKGKTTAQRAMQEMGRIISNNVAHTIAGMSSPKNAPITIKKKGFDDPLVETGTLENSIEYRVVRVNERKEGFSKSFKGVDS